MPIEVQIDHDRHLVIATPKGALSFEDMVGYQQDVWSNPAIAQYDELVDMGGVTTVVGDTIDNVERLAALSSGMNRSKDPTKLAIVAVSDFHYGMGRMYKALRQRRPESTKQVEVFRGLADALKWLERG